MLEYVRGKLTGSTLEKATVEVGGLGYRFYIPFSTYAKLPPQGQEVLLYVTTIIREDSQRRFGFLSMGERDLFEEFNQISGIGPKTSLSLVGHMDIADLQLAVSQKNATALCKIPGIGKKTAERLVVELKDRLKKLSLPSAPTSPSGKKNLMIEDAIAALINLGYPAPRAERAVKTVLDTNGESLELSQLITQALKISR
ncbi:MAG: Holliday junction branch migration protein RuvA [Chlamydiales bacterium]|nr:Holliday junction branch migration protein RuvA [Chlamydiales bacterium]